MAISLSYHKLFTIGVDSLMMLKWSHATDNQHGSIQPSFFYSVLALIIEVPLDQVVILKLVYMLD